MEIFFAGRKATGSLNLAKAREDASEFEGLDEVPAYVRGVTRLDNSTRAFSQPANEQIGVPKKVVPER